MSLRRNILAHSREEQNRALLLGIRAHFLWGEREGGREAGQGDRVSSSSSSSPALLIHIYSFLCSPTHAWKKEEKPHSETESRSCIYGGVEPKSSPSFFLSFQAIPSPFHWLWCGGHWGGVGDLGVTLYLAGCRTQPPSPLPLLVLPPPHNPPDGHPSPFFFFPRRLPTAAAAMGIGEWKRRERRKNGEVVVAKPSSPFAKPGKRFSGCWWREEGGWVQQKMQNFF